MKNCSLDKMIVLYSLDKKRKELRRWSLILGIWAITVVFGFGIFLQLMKGKIIHEPNLPWWIFVPCILIVIPWIVLLIKGWQYDKLKKSQNHRP